MKNGMNAVSFVMLLVAILATASISWAAGGYQYNLQCNGCHGAPPLDEATRNPVTGAFGGNHQTHVQTNPVLNPAPGAAASLKCDTCHFDAAVVGQNKPSAFIAGHSDGKIQMFSKYNKGTFINQTSVTNMTTATCATVNCHFESTTPTWGSAMPATPADCNLCHNTPPSAGVSGASHSTHYKYSPAWGGLFGPLACTPCHTDGGVNGTATFTYQHATSAGNRAIHFDSTLNYVGSNGKFLPSQSATRQMGACSNTYCHSNGVGGPGGVGNVTIATPVWGNTTNCGSCHAAKPVTNGHAVHVTNYNYSCDYCHVKTVTTDPNTGISSINTTTGYQYHTNKAINVDVGGLAGAGTGVASCSTTYCHAGSTVTPVWNNAATVTCGSCHKADNATLGSKAHPAHLNSAVLYGPTALQALSGGSSATSCKICHTNYPTNHAKGTVDVTLTSCNPCHVGSLTTTTWGAGRVTCESCHVGATRSVISGVTAPDETLSSTKGHTQSTFTGALTCNSCHNPNAAHIGNTTHIARLTLANDNTQCASCHNTGKTIAIFQNMSTHFTTKGGAQDMTCKTCHSPHGTTNLHMVKTQLKGAWLNATAVTITYTDSVNGFINPTNNRGLCQVCHTKTKYFLAGVAESAHPTSDCLTCHKHNGKGGAFKPVGTCDGCHGYPPMPRLTGLTFGTAGNYANARFEDYTGGGGAHAIAAHVNPNAVPADGWKNCAGCHNGGNLVTAANHKTIMPIKKNIANVTVSLDPAKKFNNAKLMNYSGGKLVYPGNVTGSCTNVACHFKPSPKWTLGR